jgi:ABC-type multidrug transport system fused ATPase/permease subunit
MFERREEIEKRLYEIVERFHQKGAISPDKAMTAEELNLPPRFEVAMKRRLGRLGVFVEVNGKYYLSEERLKQIEQLRPTRGTAWASRKKILTLRIGQMVAAVFFLILFVVSFFVQSWELRVVSIFFLLVWLAISILQIYYVSRIRKRMSSSAPPISY